MYRYKMPSMILKIEGKGNGIKTNIVNLAQVAKALRTMPEYPLKYLGIEQGSQTTFKRSGGDITTIVNGSFTEQELRPQLDKFIEKYVLCQKCKLPEIVMAVDKKEKISGKCNSCGWSGMMDNKHRLAVLIVKCPPINDQDIKGLETFEGDVKPKASKSGKDDKKKSGKDKKEKGDKEKKKKKDSKKKKISVSAEDEEALCLLKEKIIKQGEVQFTYTSELLWELCTFFRDAFVAAKEQDEDSKAVTDYLYGMLKGLNIPKLLTEWNGFVIFNACFGLNVAKEVQSNNAYLDAFFSRAHRSKFLKFEVLLSLQYKLLKQYPDTDFTKFIPTIMHGFYGSDTLDKEFLMKWKNEEWNAILEQHVLYDAEMDREFKEKCGDFLKFLEEEESSSEESDEESEEETASPVKAE